MYDGLPLLSKWITVQNAAPSRCGCNKFICEILAVVEAGVDRGRLAELAIAEI